MRIVFMGTPEFAVPCLRRLVERGETVVGVFTQPDKPKGRGYQLAPPPVKEAALAYEIPVYQPQSMRDGQAFEILQPLAPDLIVVVAFGKLLPREILELPSLGCVNVHASLLPRYRGAGPIQWSVINGEPVTGVTTMQMAEGLDTGDMLVRMETPIGPDETAGALHDRLSLLGADCLEETVRQLREGVAVRTPQRDSDSNYAPMLTKELGRLDFGQSARTLHNLVRGLNPWPVAYTTLRGKRLKVYATALVDAPSGTPGVILDHRRMLVGCGEGVLELLEVQAEGSKRMSAADYMNGKRIPAGEQLGG